MFLKKARILGYSFIDFHFNYVPCVWLFCRTRKYSKIEQIHYRTLQITPQLNNSYKVLLQRDNTVSIIYQIHLQILLTEIFKIISHKNKFAKLRALSARVTCLCAYAPYTSSCLTCLRALCVFKLYASSCFTRVTYVHFPYVPYRHVLCALFARLKKSF